MWPGEENACIGTKVNRSGKTEKGIQRHGVLHILTYCLYFSKVLYMTIINIDYVCNETMFMGLLKLSLETAAPLIKNSVQ